MFSRAVIGYKVQVVFGYGVDALFFVYSTYIPAQAGNLSQFFKKINLFNDFSGSEMDFSCAEMTETFREICCRYTVKTIFKHGQNINSAPFFQTACKTFRPSEKFCGIIRR